jgi:hypothetical protein
VYGNYLKRIWLQFTILSIFDLQLTFVLLQLPSFELLENEKSTQFISTSLSHSLFPFSFWFNSSLILNRIYHSLLTQFFIILFIFSIRLRTKIASQFDCLIFQFVGNKLKKLHENDDFGSEAHKSHESWEDFLRLARWLVSH